MHNFVQHSWKWFLYYRTHNVNRPSKQEGVCSSKSKRPRVEDRTVHLYPPIHGEDDVSYGRNLELLKAEMLRSKPRTDILKDLMSRTFPNRWGAFVNHNEPATLMEYLSMFPLLKRTTYVRYIFTNFFLHPGLYACRQVSILLLPAKKKVSGMNSRRSFLYGQER